MSNTYNVRWLIVSIPPHLDKVIFFGPDYWIHHTTASVLLIYLLYIYRIDKCTHILINILNITKLENTPKERKSCKIEFRNILNKILTI